MLCHVRTLSLADSQALHLLLMHLNECQLNYYSTNNLSHEKMQISF